MNDLPKVFIDTSVVLAAMQSPDNRSRNLLFFTLSGLGYVDLRMSSAVLAESEGVLRRLSTVDFEENKARLATLLARSNVGVASEPSTELIAECVKLTN